MTEDSPEARAIFAYYRSITDGTFIYEKTISPHDLLRAQLIVSAGYDAFLKTERLVAVLKPVATAG